MPDTKKRKERNQIWEVKYKSWTSDRLCDADLRNKTAERERKLLTVQTHIMEGEDGRPSGGSCAVEGHVQNTMRGLNAVLLERAREKDPTTNSKSDTDLSGVRLHFFTPY